MASKELELTLKKPIRLRPRHPWIYKSQIADFDKNADPGRLATLSYPDRLFYARGYYNPNSEIAFRTLSFKNELINQDFLWRKIQKALLLRRQLVRETNAFRLISSEADDLPGLIVDSYADFLVVQFLTYGMENLKPIILEILKEKIPNKGIYEKSQSHARELEGLSLRTGWITKECGDKIEIFERDIRYEFQIGEGHKTGFYLDQRDNRLKLRDLGLRGKALDCFCFTGGFSLHLSKVCDEVLGIDIQEESIQTALNNQKLNGIPSSRLQFKTANVFDELKNYDREKRKFNLIVLDPPSFVKRKDALNQAITGFKEIILRSMKLLEEDGFLAVFSCSYHVDDQLLMQISQEAALDVKKSIRVVQFMKQSLDHPINPFIPETYYLKGFLFLVQSAN